MLVDSRFWLTLSGLLKAVSGRDSVSGDCPAVSVVVEPEADEPTQVDSGDS